MTGLRQARRRYTKPEITVVAVVEKICNGSSTPTEDMSVENGLDLKNNGTPKNPNTAYGKGTDLWDDWDDADE